MKFFFSGSLCVILMMSSILACISFLEGCIKKTKSENIDRSVPLYSEMTTEKEQTLNVESQLNHSSQVEIDDDLSKSTISLTMADDVEVRAPHKYLGPCSVELYQYKKNKKNGIVDTRAIYEYEPGSGLLLRQEVDDDDNGGIDMWKKFIYEPDGKLIKMVYQDKRNHIVRNTTVNFVYDNEDRVIRREMDMTSDGIVDFVWSFKYENSGQIVMVSYGRGGQKEECYGKKFILNKKGELIARIDYLGCGQNIDTKWDFEYNKNHDLINVKRDHKGDGEIEFERLYIYDKHQRKIAEKYRGIGFEGINIEKLEHVLHYDNQGNVRHMESDSFRITFHYDCWEEASESTLNQDNDRKRKDIDILEKLCPWHFGVLDLLYKQYDVCNLYF